MHPVTIPQIYLDTSVVIGALHPGIPDSAACALFAQQLAAQRTRIYISFALRIDFGRAVRRIATKPDKIPAQLRNAYSPDEWGPNPLVRHRWLRRELRLLDGFLQQFAVVTEIPLNQDIWTLSIEIMGAEGLDATDALHLAAARAEWIPAFATCDRDFRRIAVPHIHLIRDNAEQE